MNPFLKILLFISFIVPINLFAFRSESDSLIHELKNIHTDSVRASILLAICNDRLIEKDSLRAFAEQAVALADKTQYQRLISMAYNNLCNWHFDHTDNFDTIIYYCRKHYARVESLKFVSGMAQASGNLGRAYLWNSLDSAMYFDLKSVELYNQAKKFEFANNAKVNLANVYIEMKRYKEAIAILNETANYTSPEGVKSAAGISYLNMGACYLRINDLTNAEKSFMKSISDGDQDPYSVAYLNYQLADVYCAQGRYELADKMYSQVLESGKTNHLDYIIFLGYNGLANLSFRKKQWADAIRYKKLTWEYSYKDRATEEGIYEMLYKCDSALGNYRNTLASFQKYISIRDSYASHERLKSADALEAKYQNKEKQTKIELLNAENNLKQEATARQELIRNVFIGFSVAVILLSVLLFNRLKLKKKIDQQNALLTERKRIGRELHDDLGAQLSTAKMFLQSIKQNKTGDTENVALDNSLSLIESSIRDLRTIMEDLHTSTLQANGYIAATEELVNKINDLQKVKFQLLHTGMEKRINQKAEHILFRITQELINNTMKYSQAKNVSVDLVKQEDKIVLMYEDDGIGFDLHATNRGYGLSNIESRAAELNASIAFDTFPGKGFRAILEIPLDYAV
jgi:signal transduction histidine kinase